MLRTKSSSIAIDITKQLIIAKDKLKVFDDKISALNWTAAAESLQHASNALHAVRVAVVGNVDTHTSHEIHQTHRFPKVYLPLRELWKSRVDSMRVHICSVVDQLVEVKMRESADTASLVVRKSIGAAEETFVLLRRPSNRLLRDRRGEIIYV